MPYKCIDDRWDDGTSIYDSVEDFQDMCRDVFGVKPPLYRDERTDDGLVRELTEGPEVGPVILEPVEG